MGIRHNDRDNNDNDDGGLWSEEERCGDVSREELDLDDDGGGDPRPLGGGFSFSSTDWSGWED